MQKIKHISATFASQPGEINRQLLFSAVLAEFSKRLAEISAVLADFHRSPVRI